MDPDSFMTIYDHISTRGPARLGIPTAQLTLTSPPPPHFKKQCQKEGKVGGKRGLAPLGGIRHLLHWRGFKGLQFFMVMKSEQGDVPR